MQEDLAIYAIDYARRLDTEYADARFETHYNELITVASGKVHCAMKNQKRGIGIRVLVKGAWGFQSTTNLSKEGIKNAVSTAFKIAKASSKHVPTPVKLAQTKEYQDSYATKVETDLEDIAFEEKIKTFLKWEENLHTSEAIVRGSVDYTGIKIDKLFVNSEGANIKFANTVTWVSLKADANKGGLAQSYHQAVGHAGGYEIFEKQDVEELARETGKKAESLLKAQPPKEETNVSVILDPDYVALLCHEICGHPSEADRVLGREAAWAGTAWWAGKIGEKVGSEYYTIYDDPTIPGTLGNYRYDDEGVKGTRKVLADKGFLKAHMHSRETAAIFGVEPNAGMRAVTYEYTPLIRMSNTFFADGDWDYDEMIKETKHGILVGRARAPSIDDRRFNWTISAQEGYEIKDGQLTTHLRDVQLTSTAPQFFKSLDAASKKGKIEPLPGCGKGDPMQVLYVGNGGPYIRGTANVLGAR